MSRQIMSFYKINIYISVFLRIVYGEFTFPEKNDDIKAVAAYAGSVVRLPCKNKKNSIGPVWSYAESLNHLTFSPLEDKDNTVEERDALLIYNVRKSETGVYRCEIGDISRLVSLEVVDDEEYNVVKPQSSHGPYAIPPRTLDNAGLIVFSAWTPWSECSACGAVGRRRRYGMCHVKPKNRKTTRSRNFLKSDMKIFKDLPSGLPCRSEYLPECIRSLPDIKKRLNEIMIGLCKVPCKRAPKEDVDIILTQRPSVVRDIIFAKVGQTVKLRCPGAIYRDAPYNWAASGARVSPRTLFEESDGRARVDARDRLVFSPIGISDEGIYSCGAYDQTRLRATWYWW